MTYDIPNFKKDAIKIHGNKYDYSRISYKNKLRGSKQIIICPEHGEFEHTYHQHVILGYGCLQCSYKNPRNKGSRKSPELLKEEIIFWGKRVHGNKYDYSEVSYVNKTTKDKVTIICPKHGKFEQTIGTHKKHGCSKCSAIKKGKDKRYNAKFLKNRFIKEARKVHGNKYDYSEVSYKNKLASEKVTIIDPDHGKFEQNYSNHVALGHGHPSPKAYMKNKVIEQHGTISYRRKNFLLKAKSIHNNLYLYPNLKEEFQGYTSSITVICPNCGPIKQIAHNHMRGHGCSKCKRSFMERELENWLRAKISNIRIEIGRRDIIPPFEIDIWLPRYKVAIEIGGLYWHSKYEKSYHQNKQKECEKLGIKLFTIFDVDWYQKKNICKSMIRNSLGKISLKIPGRKCKIKIVSGSKARKFLLENHIQGYSPASINLGLYFNNNKLVALLTLGKPRYNKNYQWEIIRFGSKINTIVQGGFSKLWSYFVINYRPKNCITYANLRWGIGNVYLHAGFFLLRKTIPSAWWSKVDGSKKWLHRSNVQKHKLKNLLNEYDSSKTAEENLVNNHWVNVWDCGNNVYGWTRETFLESTKKASKK